MRLGVTEKFVLNSLLNNLLVIKQLSHYFTINYIT